MWTISGKDYLRKEFQKQLPNLLQIKDDKVHSQVTILHVEFGLAGVDAFRCDVKKILDYLIFLFEKGYKYRTIECHRSAISAFHDYVEGKPVRQHPEV